MGRWFSRATRGRVESHFRYLAPPRPPLAGGLVGRVYAQLERDFGMLAPPITLHAPAPESLAAAWLMLRETLLAAGEVSRAAKETVAVAVSLANACPYCVEVHSAALHGLVRSDEAGAVGDGRLGAVRTGELRQVAAWAGMGRRAGAAAPAPARQAPELVGTAVTFHYLNRMVDIFLIESPIPPGTPAAVRRTIRRLAGALLRPRLRRTLQPGAALDLLPASALPADLIWAAGSPSIGAGFARSAAAFEAAGRRSVPESVRELVTAELAGWDGALPGPSSGWARERVAGLPVDDRATGRLALLTSLAPYQAGPAVIEDFRRYRPDDRSLIEVTAWAAMAAARWWGARLWREWLGAAGQR